MNSDRTNLPVPVQPFQKEEADLEDLSRRISEFENSYIDSQNRLVRAKERSEARKAEIKSEIASNPEYTNDFSRKARERELLTEPSTVSLEQDILFLDTECRRAQTQIDSLKRSYTIRLIRFKNLLGVH